MSSGPRKANLFIVGAPKCGTTAWVQYLSDHPDISFSSVKEPHFFATDLPGRRQITDQADYDALFAAVGNSKFRGEASVFYLFSKAAAEAISVYNPAAKILVFLRNQEDLLPSLHHQFLYTFNESIEDFSVAWKLSGSRPPDTIPATCREPKVLDYAAVGEFDEQLKRYLARFPRSQICVLQFEEWIADPASSYRRVLDFLGLEDDQRRSFSAVNEAKHHRSKTLARLLNYRPERIRKPIHWLKQHLGLDSQIGALLGRMNSRPGYATKISPDLAAEIRSHYERCNANVERQISSLADHISR